MRGRLWHVTLTLIVTIATAALVTACGESTTSGQDAVASPSVAQPAVLTSATAAVQAALDTLNADLAAAAKDLSLTGLKGAEAEAILQGLADAHPEVVDFWSQDGDGKILAIEPAEYAHFVGTQGQPRDDAALLAEAGRAQLTATTRAEEGFQSAAIIHPIIAGDGTMLGAVAAFLNTDQFLGAHVEPLAQAEGLDTIWAMDTEGNNIYDPDKQDVDHNLITSEYYAPYPTLVALAKQMAQTASGYGTYDSPPSKTNASPILKQAYWDSVGLHDTEWRLVAAFSAPQDQQ